MKGFTYEEKIVTLLLVFTVSMPLHGALNKIGGDEKFSILNLSPSILFYCLNLFSLLKIILFRFIVMHN